MCLLPQAHAVPWFYALRRQSADDMERLTVRVPEDLLEEIEDLADAEDVSTSEAARRLLRKGTEAEVLEQEAERLRREKRLILEQREEHTELVRQVRSDRTLAERKAQAGLLTKAKWALFGMSDDEKESEE